MIDAVISASWSFPSSWRPCPRRGPLFEKPRKTTGGPKGGLKQKRTFHLATVYWTIGWSGVWVISSLVGWAKYCLASLSSSRLSTLRRVQHLIPVFNNIEFRLQNGPMCESILVFSCFFRRFHGFVFWTFKGAYVEHWIFAAAARGGLEGRGGVDLNGIQWEFMEIVVDN